MRLLLYSPAFFSLMLAVAASGQKTEQTGSSYNPFAKGNFQFTDRQNLWWNHSNVYDGDTKLGSLDAFRINGDVTAFVGGGFGIGGSYRIRTNGSHYGGTDDLYREWTASATFSYGKHFASNFNLYGELSAGYGKAKNIYKTPSTTDELSANLTTLRAKIAAPIWVDEHTFLTPYTSFNYQKWDYPDFVETETNFGFGVKCETYIRPADVNCGFSGNNNLSAGLYDQGTEFHWLFFEG